LVECEGKELLETVKEDGRIILKMALVKYNGNGGNYIHLVQDADNGLYNTAIYLHVP
jgi:glutathione synthase/RimK-type ligase-like ATP-grasp enzyme